MIDLECPKCGRIGSIPPSRANSRLVCKKCMSVFHMGATGRAVLGEPASAHHDPHGHDAATAVKKAEASAPSFDLGEINYGLVGVLAVLLLIGGVYAMTVGFGSRSATNVYPHALEMANAIETSDANAVQALATSDSAGEASTWFQSAQRTVEEMKKGNGLKVTAIVTTENAADGTAQVEFFLIPIKAQARNEQIAREAGAPVGKVSELMTFWTFAGGRWRFDAKKTVQINPGGAG